MKKSLSQDQLRNSKSNETAFNNVANEPLVKKWLTIEEVCCILGVSKRTLQNKRDRKEIPFSQINRKILFKNSDVDEYLEHHYIKASYQKGGAA